MGWATEAFCRDLGLAAVAAKVPQCTGPVHGALLYKGQIRYFDEEPYEMLIEMREKIIAGTMPGLKSSRKDTCLEYLDSAIKLRFGNIQNNKKKEGDSIMSDNRLRSVPRPEDNTDLVKVCSDRHIVGQTDRAIKVRIGQTLYGEQITTFYPKSMVLTKPNSFGGYDVFVPRWVNRKRECHVGDFEVQQRPGFNPLPF